MTGKEQKFDRIKNQTKRNNNNDSPYKNQVATKIGTMALGKKGHWEKSENIIIYLQLRTR